MNTTQSVKNSQSAGRTILVQATIFIILLLPLNLPATTVVDVEANGVTPIKIARPTDFLLQVYSDNGAGTAPGPLNSGGPDAALAGLSDDSFIAGKTTYPTVVNAQVGDLPRINVLPNGTFVAGGDSTEPNIMVIPGLKNNVLINRFQKKPAGEDFVESISKSGTLPAVVLVTKGRAVTTATDMSVLAAAGIAKSTAGAKAIDPGMVSMGAYTNYSPSLTNVSLSVDQFGSSATFDVIFTDSQDTNTPVWSLTVSAAQETFSPGVLQVEFNYDTNRLTIIDTNNPSASYSTLTNEIANAIISQFSVISNTTLYAGTLTIFTNGTYNVIQTNTSFLDAVGGGVVEAPPLIVSGIVANPNGSHTLSFSGAAGGTYLVQAGTNLPPSSAWQTISTNVADTNGFWQFTDPNAPARKVRFYRASSP
jgi:hypothetical protein